MPPRPTFPLLGSTQDHASAFRFVLVVLGVYLAGLLLFYPVVPSVRDEVKYVEQAWAYSQGFTCYAETDAVDGSEKCALPARYLPGTATAMLPFVWAFGWRGSFLLSALSLLVAVGVTAHWLRGRGRSPLFALMLIGYPSVLVFGRIAMSDVPSMALAALGLWLFWTRDRGTVWRSALVGAIAGVALQFRETNVLVFFILFSGALLRRERGVVALVLGGLVAMLLRPLGTWIAFGDPFFVFPHGPTFSPLHIVENLPIYTLTLMVFLPGGALGVLAYRGERRPEVLLTFVVFLTVYLLYGYSGATGGPVRHMMLAPRYFMPLTPLIVFACAESFPRLLEAVRARVEPERREALGRWVHGGVRLWAAGVLVLAFAVHPAHDVFNSAYVRVKQGLYANTPEGAVVVFNSRGLRKYLNRLYGGRVFVRRQGLRDADVVSLLERHGEFYIAFMNRSGSHKLLRQAALNDEFVERARSLADVQQVHESPGGVDETLRIWHATRREDSSGPPP